MRRREFLLLLVACTVTPALAADSDWFPYLGLRLDPSGTVVETTDGSPARNAGLLPGDRIVRLGSRTIEPLPRPLRAALLRGDVGSTVQLTYRRGSSLSTVWMTRAPLHRSGTLDDQLLVVSARTAHTPACEASLRQALAMLPDGLKRRFVSYGVILVLTPTLDQLTGKPGGSEFDPQNNRAILCERSTGHEQDPQNDRRLPITTLHELGHACDKMLGYASRTPDFLAAYDREAPGVPEADRAILAHFLQKGRAGPSECFASLFACRYFHAPDRRLDTLRRCFPQTFELAGRRLAENEA